MGNGCCGRIREGLLGLERLLGDGRVLSSDRLQVWSFLIDSDGPFGNLDIGEAPFCALIRSSLSTLCADPGRSHVTVDVEPSRTSRKKVHEHFIELAAWVS